MSLMKCRVCECTFDPSDSTGGCEGVELCQDCWEHACDDSWWDMASQLEPTGEPDEYVLVPESMQSEATVSDCGRYRYNLIRVWDAQLPRVCWIMLNPSTADAATDDPTIRKCIGFARRWGFGSIEVINVYPFRCTNPKDLPDGEEIEGNGILQYGSWRRALGRCQKGIAAWGAHDVGPRDEVAIDMFRDLDCLGTTQDGSPKHPLYPPYDTVVVAFARDGERCR